MRTKSGPDVVQIYEGGTRFMADSGFIIPAQNLIEEYKIDISKFEPNILAYYTVNGKINSLPFNTSLLLMYYNKTLLTQMGYPNGPSDFAELKEIALKVVAMRNPSIPYGYVQYSDPWILEQQMVMAGIPLVDNNNGRNAAPTRCVLDQSDFPARVLRTWLDLKTSGAIADLGFQY
jgi:sn-glycerol 3-phosphate transport system substrate-binding protein